MPKSPKVRVQRKSVQRQHPVLRNQSQVDAEHIPTSDQDNPSYIRANDVPDIVRLQRQIGNSSVNMLLSRGVIARKPNVIQRDWMDDAGSWVADTASSAADTVSGAASSAYNTVADAASGAYDTASSAVSTAAGFVSDTLGLDQIIAQIQGIILSIQREAESQIDGLIGGIQSTYENVEKLVTGDLKEVMEMPTAIQEKAQAFMDALVSGRGENADQLEGMWQEWKPLAQKFADAIPSLEGLQTRVTELEGQLEPQIANVEQLISGFEGQAGGQLTNASIPLPSLAPLKAQIAKVAAALRAKWNALVAKIRSLIASFKAWWGRFSKYLHLKNVLKPWFWLNVFTLNAYADVIARGAFKAAYSHYLPRRFIDNYIDQGGTLNMDEKDMGQCSVVVDVTKSPVFVKAMKDAFEEASRKVLEDVSKPITFDTGAIAATHGTLGSFHINYDGTVTVGVDGWRFDGQMNFHDLWDFDWTVSDLLSGGGHRSFYGELMTMIGDEFLPGEGFDIDSVNAHVTQTDKDAEANWSGKGIPGVPSKIAGKFGKETGEVKSEA